jgi:hypothetical protein
MSLASDVAALDETVKFALIIGGVWVAYNVYVYLRQPGNDGNPLGWLFPDPNDTEGNPNSIGDTSQSGYAGNGALGSLANIINQALSGIPQSVGNSIGAGLSNLTNNSQEQ